MPFLIVSVIAGIAIGIFAHRLFTAGVAVTLFEVVAAPLMYYIQPRVHHGAPADADTSALIAIPFLAVVSGLFTLAGASLAFFARRFVQKRRPTI